MAGPKAFFGVSHDPSDTLGLFPMSPSGTWYSVVRVHPGSIRPLGPVVDLNSTRIQEILRHLVNDTDLVVSAAGVTAIM
jgi:hypothetical protein